MREKTELGTERFAPTSTSAGGHGLLGSSRKERRPRGSEREERSYCQKTISSSWRGSLKEKKKVTL